MFRWNMSLETGIPPVDQGRRQLVEAFADFFQVLDDPGLNQRLVAERTGAIFKAMKAAFTAEEEYLKTRPEEDSTHHLAKHASYTLAYVDLCKKLVPKIKSLKQAQQACLEIYRCIEHGVYHHLTEEAQSYRHMHRNPEKTKVTSPA